MARSPSAEYEIKFAITFARGHAMPDPRDDPVRSTRI